MQNADGGIKEFGLKYDKSKAYKLYVCIVYIAHDSH